MIADVVCTMQLAHPVRIAIDGRTASGKTTVADELAVAIRANGRPVIRTSIDGFHRPRAERYARGRRSPEGYYYDARDLWAVRSMLLDPLGPDGDRWYRTASFDLKANLPIDIPPRKAARQDALIVDGTFLQRPELRDAWDVIVFVDVPEEISALRGCARDAEQLGGLSEASSLYRERYLPAYKIYQAQCDPVSGAHILLGNRDFATASVRIQRLP